MNYFIGMRVPKNMLEEIDAYAEEEQCMSRSDAARDLLRTALKTRRNERAKSRC